MLLILLLLPFATAGNHSPNYNYSALNPPCGSSLREKILNTIFCNYDNSVRPPPGDTPTQVVCNAAVLSISSVHEDDFNWRISVYIRQEWIDPRLAYSNMVTGCPDIKYLSLITVADMALPWTPNLFFPDAIHGQVLDTIQQNQVVRCYPDGSMFMSSHCTVQLYCSGDGIQPGQWTCPMKMYSYGFEVDEMKLKWLATNPVQLANTISIKGFTLGPITTNSTVLKSETGSYAQIEADFVFKNS